MATFIGIAFVVVGGAMVTLVGGIGRENPLNAVGASVLGFGLILVMLGIDMTN